MTNSHKTSLDLVSNKLGFNDPSRRCIRHEVRLKEPLAYKGSSAHQHHELSFDMLRRGAELLKHGAFGVGREGMSFSGHIGSNVVAVVDTGF